MKIFLPILCLLFLAPPAWAKVVVRTHTDYYWVDGYGRQDIVESHTQYIRANHKNGYTAYAKPDIEWKYSYENNNGICSMDKVNIRLEITYMYPKLRRKQTTQDRKWWEGYQAELEEHELVHGEIAKRGAKAMDAALMDIQNMDCDRFKNRANDVAKRVWDETNQRQDDYDDLTQHGIQQHKFRGL